MSNCQNTLVIAGAGCGKSYTIIAKIIYLIKICHVNPQKILCISFTNDATNSLQTRLFTQHHINIDIYTFHKLALNIFKQHNITYEIAPDNYLETITDNFLKNLFNPKLVRSLKIVQKKYQYSEIKKIIINYINIFKGQNYNLTYFINILKKIKTINIKEYLSNKHLLLLIINIYLQYEQSLNQNNALDFNDMINKSIELLKTNGLKKKWEYIIVDEYQDTSFTKFLLIKELINCTNAKFIAVGDDFQSIYRFTGCNIQLFLDFSKYFPNSKIYYLNKTYRNPQELINVAGSFIMKNKYQYPKQLISSKNLAYPIQVYFAKNEKNIFKKIVQKNEKQSLFVLGRNNNDILYYLDETFKKISPDCYQYQNTSFRYLTMHKSKGLEADNIIIINMHNNEYGFPSKVATPKIITNLTNPHDKYPFEEERRLFYVALTRTKNYVYIICPFDNYSPFIKEIIKYKRYIKKIKESK